AMLQAHGPGRAGLAGTGLFQAWVMGQYLAEDRLLGRTDVDEEQVLTLAQAIGEAAEGAVGLLQAEQAALPDAEAEQYRGEEDEGDPARRGRGPVVEPGQQQYQYRQGDADQAADGAGVDQVAPEDRRHLVQ